MTSRTDRGMALVLVLVIMVVLFLLGVAVAGLSSNNSRLVSNVQDGVLARNAAQAGLARAQVVLNNTADWTTVAGTLPVTDHLLSSERPATYYTVRVLSAPNSNSIVVESTGYVKYESNAPPRNQTVMTVRYQRCAGAFLYPLQAAGSIALTSSSKVIADDIAIRTNSAAPGSVTVDGTSSIMGEFLVGPTSDKTGIVVPEPSKEVLTSAAGTAPMQPVVAPSLSPGLIVRSSTTP